MSNTSDQHHDDDDLSKGHVRHQEQARPLGKSIKSDRLQKREESEPVSPPAQSEPLSGFVE